MHTFHIGQGSNKCLKNSRIEANCSSDSRPLSAARAAPELRLRELTPSNDHAFRFVCHVEPPAVSSEVAHGLQLCPVWLWHEGAKPVVQGCALQGLVDVQQHAS